MQPPKPLYSYLAAAGLALITIFTFYVYRDFGPQSVIRRFHLAAGPFDVAELNRVTVQGAYAPSTRYLCGVVRRLGRAGATFEVVDIQRYRGDMLVSVEYRLPGGARPGGSWYVQNTDGDWRIDCEATVSGRQLQTKPR